MSRFVASMKSNPLVLTEGAIIERLKREFEVELDPEILHAGLIYDLEKSKTLEKIYRQYIDIACRYEYPIMIQTPTHRASPNRVKKSIYSDRAVNEDNYKFLDTLRRQYGNYGENIFIGGLMGCKGDAYIASEALSSAEGYEFHQIQAKSLSRAGVDFLFAAVMPAVSECNGMAKAMADTGTPYIISFVIRDTGTLLDGTPLDRAIAEIDASVHLPPLFYMVNCIHPNVLYSALQAPDMNVDNVLRRLYGIQANTSQLSPEQLNESESLQGDQPAEIVEALFELRRKWGFKVLGGCCGTDDRHIEGIAERMKQQW